MLSLLYVLRLEDGYYYIDNSDNLNLRIAEHQSYHGPTNSCPWTKLHPMVSIEKVCLLINGTKQVDATVKEYMTLYGIDKVRGGSYQSEVLDQETIAKLKYELQVEGVNHQLCLTHFFKESSGHHCNKLSFQMVDIQKYNDPTLYGSYNGYNCC